MESEPRDSSADHLPAWLAVLDELTYYELFGIPRHADSAAIHAAFHAFCDAFHPNRHVGRGARDHEAVRTIFKRGAEAYIVLADPALRRQYDEQLAVRTTSRPPRMSLSPLSRPPLRPGEGAIEDVVRSPVARPFARRADELIAKGDLRQAKLQLVMANHMDPDNGALEAALRDVEAKLGSQK